jgi:hypothetical protein
VLTDVGPVEIAVPRDRDGSFEPKIVKKRQKRVTGVDEMVISLAAKGLTNGEVRLTWLRSMAPRSLARPSHHHRQSCSPTRASTATPSKPAPELRRSRLHAPLLAGTRPSSMPRWR